MKEIDKKVGSLLPESLQTARPVGTAEPHNKAPGLVWVDLLTYYWSSSMNSTRQQTILLWLSLFDKNSRMGVAGSGSKTCLGVTHPW